MLPQNCDYRSRLCPRPAYNREGNKYYCDAHVNNGKGGKRAGMTKSNIVKFSSRHDPIVEHRITGLLRTR